MAEQREQLLEAVAVVRAREARTPWMPCAVTSRPTA
jgi:hypothetical protein